MNSTRPFSQKSAFTLVEILVVLSIISILASLVYVAAGRVMVISRNSAAENAAYNLRNAIGAYYTDYRRYPGINDNDRDDYIDFASDERIMDVLLGADSEIGKRENPKGTSFFSARMARRFEGQRYHSGISLNDDGGGKLWDPYGRLYGCRLDRTNRGRVANPAIVEPSLSGGEGRPSWGRGRTTGQPRFVTESVLIWSSGKELELAEDNPNTWGF